MKTPFTAYWHIPIPNLVILLLDRCMAEVQSLVYGAIRQFVNEYDEINLRNTTINGQYPHMKQTQSISTQ